METRIESKQKRAVWGTVLTILGIGAMALVKVIIGRNLQMLSFSVIILSLILLFDYESMKCIGRPSVGGTLIFLYSVLTILLSLFRFIRGNSLLEMPFGLLYQGCYFAQIFFLWTRIDDFDTTYFSKSIFWFSGVLSVISTILILRNYFFSGVLLFGDLGMDSQGKTIITRASTGEIAVISIFASLAYTPHKKTEKTFKVGFVFAAGISLILSNRRTTTAAVLLSLLLYIFYYPTRDGRIDVHFFKKKTFIGICALAVIMAIATRIPQVVATVTRAFVSLINAIGNFMSIGDAYDMSANMRRNAMESAVSQILSETSALKLFFGHGYGTLWLDVPVLEAFWELGLFGGIFFFAVQVLVPIKFISDKRSDDTLRFVQFWLVLSLIQGFSSGVCYGIFFPMVLYCVVDYQLQRKDNCRVYTEVQQI